MGGGGLDVYGRQALEHKPVRRRQICAAKKGALCALLLFLFSTLTPYTSFAELVVEEVIDGDTIRLNNGQVVRYVGINAPELHRVDKITRELGRAAKSYNEQLVLGRAVTVLPVGPPDKYGRTVAYVIVPGAFVNAVLVQRGFAAVASTPKNHRHKALFVRLEEEAKRHRRGLWGEVLSGLLPP